MLLDQRELAGIETGRISVVFRHWRIPRIRLGTRLRTPIGLVEVTEIARTLPHAVTEGEAQAAGFSGLEEFRGWLEDRPGEFYRIGVRWAGEDPRVALRQDTDLDESALADIQERFARMDARAEAPWTWQTLRVIAANTGVVSTELAVALGLDRPLFKQRVRRLKELGLTESLEVGYRISPRGRALLDAVAGGAEEA